LNAGPGGIAGAFVHQKHLGSSATPRFEGWWGHNKSTRFKMGPQFEPLPTAEAWQLSNPPIFQLASLRASMELFDAAGIQNLREKGDRLTAYFEWLLRRQLDDKIEIVTPGLPERGSMLCLRFRQPQEKKYWQTELKKRHIHVDFREPDILRATPVPLYNSFEDVFRLVTALKEVLS
jgi:kynureninase